MTIARRSPYKRNQPIVVTKPKKLVRDQPGDAVLDDQDVKPVDVIHEEAQNYATLKSDFTVNHLITYLEAFVEGGDIDPDLITVLKAINTVCPHLYVTKMAFGTNILTMISCLFDIDWNNAPPLTHKNNLEISLKTSGLHYVIPVLIYGLSRYL